MTIINTDIVLFQSQDNTDNNNGGGARTATPVADGAVNNLFPDISRIDTVAGDVALRKVFPVVNTDNRDIYYGAHSIIRKVPDDNRVSALLFYTDDATDVRSQAQSDIESYLIPSFQASFYLFGSNIEGAKAVTFIQRVEEPIPAVGDVYVLQEGLNEQYIRFADIETTDVLYFFNNRDYTRRRIIATIDQPLTTTFTGSDFNPAGQTANTCDTFATQVADSAKFFGNKGITVDALAGDTFLQLESIFEQLVPASTQQTPVINRDALQSGKIVIMDSTSPPSTEFLSLNASNPIFQLRTPIQPGTLSLSSSYTDDGNGNLTRDGSDDVARIDYVEGTISFTGDNFSATLTYLPGVVLDTFINQSTGILITTENQGTVYIRSVAPVPDPGSCYVDYRSNGKWYRIQGNSDNTLGDASGLGAGLISDNGNGTASISVTLGAVPDLESTVIFAWGSTDQVNKVRQEAIDNVTATLEWKLPHENIDPDNCVINYGNTAGSPVVLTFSATNTSIVDSNATFRLNAKEGILTMVDNGTDNVRIPGNGSNATSSNFLGLSYDYADAPTAGQAGERILISSPVLTNAVAGTFTYDIGATTEIENVDIVLSAIQNVGFRSEGYTLRLSSDASGILREVDGGIPWGTVTSAGLITINVPTVQRNVAGAFVSDGRTFPQYQLQTVFLYNITGANSIEYSGDRVLAFNNNFIGNLYHNVSCVLKLKLLPFIIGDFRFATYDTSNYLSSSQARTFITSDSEVFQIVNTNSRTQVGSIDKITGLITIDWGLQFIAGNNQSFVNDFIISGLVVSQDDPTSNIRRAVFRAGAGDLVTSSFILRYATVNGSFTATTDGNGDFTGTDINTTTSYVDARTGSVFLEFTADINPQSLKYDVVAQVTLPLDPELLGLNPVRLPPDGRVPIFYPGAFVVIFNEVSTDIGTPVANDVDTLARTGQAYIEVVDVNGQRLAYDQFTADRDAGTVTFANPLSLVDRQGDALTPPLSIIDRVEDMALCTDAGVTGRISISTPLSRDYLAGQTRVASALVWGDVGARVFAIFSQSNFDVWSDNPTTSAINAQFDNVNFPIQINNKDSFTGRWALIFQNTTTVDVIEETLGTILENAPINADIAPINPATGLPYFTIPTGGWGGGWVTSNVLRFNTESGSENMWIIRTVQSGALTEANDSIDIEIRGDIN